MSSQPSQWEFYSPFAHIPGKYEWCRIHSPSHGSFDTFIVIETTTDQPVTVYVNDACGESFMAERYPESRCIPVSAENLVIGSSRQGRVVSGRFLAHSGPVKQADMIFTVSHGAEIREQAYGGGDFSVWGSRWTCSGVDLEMKAEVAGRVVTDEDEFFLTGEEAVVTAGSSGHIRLMKE